MSAENEFLKARTQITAKIQKLETDLKYWREELGAFDRVETTMRRLGASPDGQVAELRLQPEAVASSKMTPVLKRAVEILGSYASIEPKKRGGLKMLVLDTVVKNKGQLVSSTEVERLLLQSGYKPSGKHFDISVYQTLQRLADKKLINRIKDGSKVRFASKSE